MKRIEDHRGSPISPQNQQYGIGDFSSRRLDAVCAIPDGDTIQEIVSRGFIPVSHSLDVQCCVYETRLPCSCGILPGILVLLLKNHTRSNMDEDSKKPLPSSASGSSPNLVGGRKLIRERGAYPQGEVILPVDIPSRRGPREPLHHPLLGEGLREGRRRIESLYPDERKDKGRSRVMDEERSVPRQPEKERMGSPSPSS